MTIYYILTDENLTAVNITWMQGVRDTWLDEDNQNYSGIYEVKAYSYAEALIIAYTKDVITGVSKRLHEQVTRPIYRIV